MTLKIRKNHLYRCDPDIWIIAYEERLNSYSHRRLLDYFSKKKVKVRLLTPQEIFLEIETGKLRARDSENKIMPLPDFVIPRTSGETAINIYLALEHYGVPLLNPVSGIMLGKDKWKTASVLGALNMPIPTTRLLIDLKTNPPSLPCVIKKNVSSRGRDVFLVKNKKDFLNIPKNFCHDNEALSQEFIKTSFGSDIRILIVGGKIIGSIKRESDGAFLANISQNGKATQVNISKKDEQMVLKAVKALHLNYAGVDLLIDRNGYKICEINWAADFEGFEKATGADVPKEIFNYICAKLLP